MLHAAGHCPLLPTRKARQVGMSAAHRGRNTKHLYAGERVVTEEAGREQGGSQAEDSSLVNTRHQ